MSPPYPSRIRRTSSLDESCGRTEKEERKVGCNAKCGTQFSLVNKKGFTNLLPFTLVNMRGPFFYALGAVLTFDLAD